MTTRFLPAGSEFEDSPSPDTSMVRSGGRRVKAQKKGAVALFRKATAIAVVRRDGIQHTAGDYESNLRERAPMSNGGHRGEGDLTEDELRRRCLQVQSEWTQCEERKRRGGDDGSVEVTPTRARGVSEPSSDGA